MIAQKGAKTIHGKAGSREMLTVIAYANAMGQTVPFILSCREKHVAFFMDMP